ncbi:diguanylate cyclase [Sulfurifustis variabilis]|uniref:Diguanylate cyclase n=1 Tax=Sulfurifustis variabilis TaxID=1675686 RepID=A0A1B4V5N9_9GAMM|nr:EAL domain-containing protein [Sulfurifustis variabilis]BAU48866.1 diguanylate cyclase [Sulfurifustis variabilis]
MSGTSPAHCPAPGKRPLTLLGLRTRLALTVLATALVPAILLTAGTTPLTVGVTVVVALALAWAGVGRFVIQPLRDLLYRLGIPHDVGEDAGLQVAAAQVAAKHEVHKREIDRLKRGHGLFAGINAAARQARDRDLLLREVCTLATRSGGFRHAWVGVYDSTERAFAPLWHDGGGEVHLGDFRLALDGPGAGIAAALLAGHTVTSDDIALDPRFDAGRPEALAQGLRSCAYLPLRTGGDVVATLGLYAERPGFFDTAEVSLLEEIRDEVSLCLDYLDKEEALHHLAYYDALTGLPNRVLFADRLDQALARERYRRRHVAVLMAHVDRFKEINSLHGHPVGDALLREIARRLSDAIRTGDTIARTGTAAFGLILTDVAQPGDAAIVARKIARTLEAPVEIEGREFYITLGIGASVAPGDGNDTETLLRNADTALHMVGNESGTRYRLYTPEIDARARNRFEIERELRRAIERRELELHYQPIVDLKDLRVIGAEALLRWHNARLGPVSPGIFIPIAEQNGLIVPIGEWVLKRACEQARRWKGLGLPSRIAINTSAIQLRDPEFDRRVLAVLSGEDGAPGPLLLALEITESNLMDNAEQSAEHLDRLRGRGVAVSIDDFGTGYSSLTYLKRLPVDTLKIDIGFIRDLTHDPDDAAIVKAIVALAHSLELTVVAEGVETPEQLELLRRLGCDAAQGFLFSPAVTPERFESLSRAGFAGIPAAQ